MCDRHSLLLVNKDSLDEINRGLTERIGLLLSQNGLEDSSKGFGKLIVEVVLRINRDAVFEDIHGVFGLFIIFCAGRAFDDNIGDAVAEGWCRTGVTLSHTLGKLGVGLFGGVFAFGFG